MQVFVRRCCTYRFSKKHVWMYKDSEGVVTLGNTSYIRSLAHADILFVPPIKNSEIRRGQVLFDCRSDWTSERSIRPELAPTMQLAREQLAPFSCRIDEVNEKVVILPWDWKTWLVKVTPLQLPSITPSPQFIPPLPPIPILRPQLIRIPARSEYLYFNGPVKSVMANVENESAEEEWLTEDEYKKFCANLTDNTLFTKEMWDSYMSKWAVMFKRNKDRLYRLSLRQQRQEQSRKRRIEIKAKLSGA